MDATAPAAPPSARWTVLAVALAMAAMAALAASLLPIEFPAWPAASLGAASMAASMRPGPALARASALFLGLVALVGGLLQIAALYGAAQLLE